MVGAWVGVGLPLLLWMGHMIPILTSVGKKPSASDLLMRCAMGEANTSLPSLRTWMGMPSTPIAPVADRLRMVLQTLEALAMLNQNGAFLPGQPEGGPVEEQGAMPSLSFLTLET